MEVIRRVVLADMGEELRRSLASSLSNEPDIQVVGQTGDAAELLRMVRELKPDAVVMELVLNGMDGMDVVEELSAQGFDQLVVAENLDYGGQQLFARLGGRVVCLDYTGSRDLTEHLEQVAALLQWDG